MSSVPEWPTLQTLVDFFAGAMVPVRIVPDVAVELWAKLLVNCAYNAISALAQMPYAKLAALPDIVELQQAIVHEVIAVAAAAGVTLPLDTSQEAVARIAAGMPQQRLERGRNGQTVLLWLGQHYADGAIRFDPAKPEDIEVIVAAQRWLASSPAAASPLPSYPGIDTALPTVSLSMGA